MLVSLYPRGTLDLPWNPPARPISDPSLSLSLVPARLRLSAVHRSYMYPPADCAPSRSPHCPTARREGERRALAPMPPCAPGGGGGRPRHRRRRPAPPAAGDQQLDGDGDRSGRSRPRTPRRARYQPGGALHVPYARAKSSTRDDRWRAGHASCPSGCARAPPSRRRRRVRHARRRPRDCPRPEGARRRRAPQDAGRERVPHFEVDAARGRGRASRERRGLFHTHKSSTSVSVSSPPRLLPRPRRPTDSIVWGAGRGGAFLHI